MNKFYVYAKEFLNSLQKNNIDFNKSIKNQVLNLYNVLVDKNHRIINDYLKSPAVNFNKKLSLIKSFFTEESLVKFIMVLHKNKDLVFLEKILEQIIEIDNLLNNILLVEVISVIELNEAQMTDIKNLVKQIANSESKITNKIDKNILGGLIIRYQDISIDLSVRRLLQNIEQKIFVQHKY